MLLDNLLANYGDTLTNLIKAGTPVRTGNLLKSIRPVVQSETLSIEALDYAKYVDFRTNFITDSVTDNKIDDLTDEMVENLWNDIIKDFNL